jgi:hypothetical protein
MTEQGAAPGVLPGAEGADGQRCESSSATTSQARRRSRPQSWPRCGTTADDCGWQVCRRHTPTLWDLHDRVWRPEPPGLWDTATAAGFRGPTTCRTKRQYVLWLARVALPRLGWEAAA